MGDMCCAHGASDVIGPVRGEAWVTIPRKPVAVFVAPVCGAALTTEARGRRTSPALAVPVLGLASTSLNVAIN